MATTTIAAVAPQLAGADANRMVASLSPEGQDHLLAQALVVEVAPGDVLYEPGRQAPWVFFPLSCVVSIVTVLDDGSAVETATIGREGMVGTFQALGDDQNPNGRAVVQMGGRLIRVDAAVLRAQLRRDPLLVDAIESYVRALLIHITQSVACAAAHSVSQRRPVGYCTRATG
ncbi:MAG: cyclic nucleotide-binding domain-containing protein [Actinomycetota bacterium]